MRNQVLNSSTFTPIRKRFLKSIFSKKCTCFLSEKTPPLASSSSPFPLWRRKTRGGGWGKLLIFLIFSLPRFVSRKNETIMFPESFQGLFPSRRSQSRVQTSALYLLISITQFSAKEDTPLVMMTCGKCLNYLVSQFSDFLTGASKLQWLYSFQKNDFFA